MRIQAVRAADRRLPGKGDADDRTNYDVIIIGTGAGGGTLACTLAPTGKRILLLERGDYVPREKDNWSTQAVNVEGKYNTKEVWRDSDGKELHPHTNYYVGGNTKFYGAALFRLRQRGLRRVRHHGGISPAWPIAYDDTGALLHARPSSSTTSTASAARIPTDRRPARPTRTRPSATSRASSSSPTTSRGTGCARSTCRSASCSTSRIARSSKCIRCETCDGFPCLVHAKADAQVLCVDPALRASRTSTLLTDAQVTRLETERSRPRGHAGASSSATARAETYSADVVVVSCGAINSAALLLRSANDQHPSGLANGSDVVGRHYMGHVNSVLLAISKLPEPDRLPEDARASTTSTSARRSGTTRWATSPSSASSTAYARGRRARDRAGLDARPDGQALARLLADLGGPAGPREPRHPRPRRQHRPQLHAEQRGRRTSGCGRSSKDLMKQQRRCAMHGDECHDGLFARNLFLGERIPLAGVAHQNGTIRFGRDPKTSALDANCKAHDLDNLYVVDGSFFPSSGAVNPALTIMANALRVGDHLKRAAGVRRRARRALAVACSFVGRGVVAAGPLAGHGGRFASA